MLTAARPWDSFILGTGRSQTQSSCQCKSFFQTELLLQPPARKAAEIQVTAMEQGELAQGEAPVESFILAEKQALRWWKTSPELCDNTRKFERQFLLELLSLPYSSSLSLVLIEN